MKPIERVILFGVMFILFVAVCVLTDGMVQQHKQLERLQVKVADIEAQSDLYDKMTVPVQ